MKLNELFIKKIYEDLTELSSLLSCTRNAFIQRLIWYMIDASIILTQILRPWYKKKKNLFLHSLIVVTVRNLSL